MNTKSKYSDELKIGIVQTTLNSKLAWDPKASSPQMSREEDEHAWLEICKAMRSFQDDGNTPELIIFPELSLPRTRLNDFEHLVSSLNVLSIAGVDYNVDPIRKIAKNQGLLFVPRNFFKKYSSHTCIRIVFGKSYPAPNERAKLLHLNPSWSFQGDPNIYVFDCEHFGRVGVSICYDFMDIERALIYRGQIQHLIVIAYNKDLTMFQSLADSLSRTIFCNVVICNTGFYGGSLAVSPYYEAYQRTIYEHNGHGLFTTQLVKLPVKSLIEAQHRKLTNKEININRDEFIDVQKFKHPPPGM